jgi:hypothetical protein
MYNHPPSPCASVLLLLVLLEKEGKKMKNLNNINSRDCENASRGKKDFSGSLNYL